jgi:hypothetical protein
MKIYIVDQDKYVRVTFEEVMNILKSGLDFDKLTRESIQPYLLY